MGVEKKVYSVRLDEDLLDKLRTIAKAENRSLSNLVETVLKRYAYPKNPRITESNKET